MPPRLKAVQMALRGARLSSPCLSCQIRMASVAMQQVSFDAQVPMMRHAPTQPPSRRSPYIRKSQLMRQYQSILKSNPLIVIFQHNSVKAHEWLAIRRQLRKALLAIDSPQSEELADNIKLQIINTSMFEAALKVVEFWTPQKSSKRKTIHSSDPAVASPKSVDVSPEAAYTHGLADAVYARANKISKRKKHGLEPLLSGPLMLMTFPSSSPEHLAAALRIVSPSKQFPAPKRRANPEYYEPAVQAGLQKLLLLGARMEGRAMDETGLKWVGGLEGGLEGLRAQLVGMLSSAGVGLASVLEGASKSLYVTLEGRRMDLAGELDDTKGATNPDQKSEAGKTTAEAAQS